MYYVCIENEIVVGIQSYEPAVPAGVSISTISNEQYNQIMAQTHRFDVASKTVVTVSSIELSQKEIDKENAIRREFLNSTDWKILRHIRQKALNTETTLTDAEYLALEQQRSDTAAQIINE
jgi:hypothetical protein